MERMLLVVSRLIYEEYLVPFLNELRDKLYYPSSLPFLSGWATRTQTWYSGKKIYAHIHLFLAAEIELSFLCIQNTSQKLKYYYPSS